RRHLSAFNLEIFHHLAKIIERAAEFFAGEKFTGANHIPKGLTGFLGTRLQHGNGDCADTPRRHVQHAQKGDIVLRMKKQTNVGKSIADFGALVKAEAAHDAIANSEAAENFFERSRLRAGAVENCDASVGIVAHQRGNLAADEFRFSGSVMGLKET